MRRPLSIPVSVVDRAPLMRPLELCAKAENPLLDKAEVCSLFGRINPSTLYRGIRLGRYPKPVKIGPGSSRWLRDECYAVLRSMMEARR